MDLFVLALGALFPFSISSVSIRGTHLPVKLETQVGQAYDIRGIQHDVRRLWETGRFDDVRVEASRGPGGTAVTFIVVESPVLRLHAVHVEPSSFRIALPLPAGTTMSALRAHQLAFQARMQMIGRGYPNAQVDYDLVRIEGNEVDLRLTIRSAGQAKVKQVEFPGDPVFDQNELRAALLDLRTRRLVLWRQHPAYSSEAVDSDLARVRSLYLEHGYFDAQVRAETEELKETDRRVHFLIAPGRRYDVEPAAVRNVCSSLLEARREAERKGILDFAATMNPDLTVDIVRGTPYRIRRIEFHGNQHYGDASLRRNFLLDEGDLLDQHLLRKSVERLNRTRLFEPVNVSDVLIRSDEKNGVADIDIRLRERKRGAWGLSGPVGPASFAGPLQASISSRLPSWGAGLFDLSTYTISLSMLAFTQPIVPALSVATKHPLIPILALQRPFSPAYGWLSGFSVVPQLGWRASVIGYATAQIQQRTLPALAGEGSQEPDLAVTLRRMDGDVPMFCRPPGPRFAWLRRGASLSLEFLGALSAI